MKKQKNAPQILPREEWPYEVPENWVWTVAKNTVNLYRGVSYKKNDAHTDKHSNDYLILRGGNISEGKIDTFADNIYVNKDLVQENQLVKNNDIVIVASTGSKTVIGRSGISYNDYTDVAFGAFLILLRPKEMLCKPYIAYFYQSLYYRESIRNLAAGVNINNIRANHILEMPVPLPPLPEQQRIVARIESLFAKLDAAAEKIRAALDQFPTRKAAILHKAFTGELTKKWRKDHGVKNTWQTVPLKEIGEIITGSTPSTKQAEYYNGNIPFIKPTELNQGRNIISSAEMLTPKGLSVSRPIRAGATCVCCIGATISKCGYLAVDGVTNQQINSIVPYNFIDDVFVYYYCCSMQFKNDLIQNSSATTLPIINKNRMSSLTITFPRDKNEQQEIVRIIDTVLEKETRAKEAAQTVLEQIALLKKSILARAFRGEL